MSLYQNDQFGGLLGGGLNGLGGSAAQALSQNEHMKRLAQMQQAYAQGYVAPVQPPAPNTVLLLIGDEE